MKDFHTFSESRAHFHVPQAQSGRQFLQLNSVPGAHFQVSGSTVSTFTLEGKTGKL